MRVVAPVLIAAMLVAAASGDRRDATADAARREATRSRTLADAAAAARARAGAARAERVRLAATVQDAERAVLRADMAAADARAVAVRLDAALARERAPIVALAGGLQSASRRPAALAVLQPGSIADQVHLRAVLTTMLPVIDARTAGLRRQVAAARMGREHANATVDAATRARTALSAAMAGLARAERSATAGARAADAGASAAAERALAYGERARALTVSADAETRAAATLAGLAALPPPEPRAGPAPRRLRPADAYRLPVVGTLAAGHGERTAGDAEPGLAFTVRPGALVVAPAAGIVRHAAPFRSYGGVVVIDHGGGWTSTLTGLGALGRRPGDRVAAGMAIGRADGRDRLLRLELRKDGRPVPPAPMVSRG